MLTPLIMQRKDLFKFIELAKAYVMIKNNFSFDPKIELKAIMLL